MKNDDLISIVVPVYNVENYLKNCVDSLLKQTYQNIEIILVDDGSTDASGNICDSYKENSKIKIIHKKNGGLSDARNSGIDVAIGKYITFVDSDDDVREDMIEYLYNLIKKNNSQISICTQNIVINKKIIDQGKKYRDLNLNTIDALRILLCDTEFNVSACSKLYDKSLFNDIRFPFGNLFEDSATTYKLFMKCESIEYGHLSKYNYYKRDNSITTSKFNEKKFQLIENIDNMVEDILVKYPSLEECGIRKKISSRFSILRQLIYSDYYKSGKIDEIIKYLKSNKKIILKSKLYSKREKIALLALLVGKRMYKLSWNIYCKVKY